MSSFLGNAINFSNGIIIFSLDKEYRYTAYTCSHFNVMKKIWNVEIEEGKCMLDYIQSNDKYKAKANFDRALGGESFVEVEEYGDEKLMRSFWENRYDPVKNDAGETIGLVVFVTDVSKYILLSKNLEKATERLDMALESGKIGVWEWDIKQNTIYWSDNLYVVFGIEKNTFELSFNNYLQLIHADDREKLLETISNTVKNHTPHIVHHRTILPNGTLKWIEGIGKLRFDSSGEPTHLVGTAQDITVEKHAESALIQNNKELLKINQELDRFVYSASHDLRAPIASMLGLINVARIEKNPQELEKLYQYQEKSLKKMDKFIQDIINYSRNSRLEVQAEEIDFRKLIDETFEQLNFTENVNKIKKTVSIVTTKPFFSDLHRIHIVFNNLISNSIKYYDGQKDSFISIKIIEVTGGVSIYIEDNGIGIPEQAQDKIFAMFFRASSNSKGSGIGLYIVKEVIDKLKGNIDFESKSGLGTTFKLFIPNSNN